MDNLLHLDALHLIQASRRRRRHRRLEQHLKTAAAARPRR
jgi:hypothetical protein